jgi:hypothetical protein
MLISPDSCHADDTASWVATWPDPDKPRSHDNDDAEHDNVGAMIEPDLDGTATAPREEPPLPWQIPGIGVSL